MGRACPLCPESSDVNLFRYREPVVDLNSQISNSTLDFGMAEQELHGSQVTCAAVDYPRARDVGP